MTAALHTLAPWLHERNLLLDRQAAAAAHDVAVHPPLQLDLVTATATTDPSARRTLEDELIHQLARAGFDDVTRRRSPSGVAVDAGMTDASFVVTTELRFATLHHVAGPQLAARVTAGQNGPTVLALTREATARHAGHAWLNDSTSVRTNLDLGLAADGIGPAATTATWPDPLGEHHATALRNARQQIAEIGPSLPSGVVERAERGRALVENHLRRHRTRR